MVIALSWESMSGARFHGTRVEGRRHAEIRTRVAKTPGGVYPDRCSCFVCKRQLGRREAARREGGEEVSPETRGDSSMIALKHLALSGYKSIRHAELELRSL